MAVNATDPHTWPFKMTGATTNFKSGQTGSYALASLDGYHNWTFLSDVPATPRGELYPGTVACCDTSATALWDAAIGKYVVYDRVDLNVSKDTAGRGAGRAIGRCETDTLADFCPNGMRLKMPLVGANVFSTQNLYTKYILDPQKAQMTFVGPRIASTG